MDLRELLSKRLKKEELDLLRASYDMVGDIAIIEIPFELEKVEKVIGEAVLELNNHIKVVAKKLGSHEGGYRLQPLKVIAGEERLVTEYKESGVRFNLDLNETYFSIRLSNERLRISKLIKPGEKVLVVGAGAGPFPLVFAKNSEVGEVVGVEINPKACEQFSENIKLNKVSNVSVVCADFKDFKSDEKFDRVVMPLPENSFDFLEKVLGFVKTGGIVHFYGFYHEDEFSKVGDFISEKCRAAEFLDFVKCGQKKPRIWRICQDFGVLG